MLILKIGFLFRSIDRNKIALLILQKFIYLASMGICIFHTSKILFIAVHYASVFSMYSWHVFGVSIEKLIDGYNSLLCYLGWQSVGQKINFSKHNLLQACWLWSWARNKSKTENKKIAGGKRGDSRTNNITLNNIDKPLGEEIVMSEEIKKWIKNTTTMITTKSLFTRTLHDNC